MVRRQFGKRSRRGFTLVEVLISLGIFAVGMVAVASIFPVALTVQKNTVDGLHAKQAERNAKALIAARTLSSGDFASITTTDVQPLPNTAPNKVFQKWSIHDRGYPQSTKEPLHADYYWTPLVQVGSGTGDTILFAFILKKEQDETYSQDPQGYYADRAGAGVFLDDIAIPKVRAVQASKLGSNFDIIAVYDDVNNGGIDVTTVFRVGDQILDNNGNLFVIKQVPAKDNSGSPVGANSIRVKGLVVDEPTPLSYIWYGEPGTNGGRSPAVAIVRIAGVVK
jgi:prepilin-type N-terminal cleavage/methylation domain-containing protein